MRGRLVMLWLLVCVIPGTIRAADPGAGERTFVRALEIFDAAKTREDYLEAAALWESLAADGIRSGALYYNLGNACYRAGDYGRAIAAYRKAQPFRPRDAYLDANLRQALAVAPGRLPAPPEPWWTHVCFWTNWLSYPEKVYLAFGGFQVAALLVVFGVLRRQRRAFLVAGAVLLGSAILSIDGGLAWSEITASRRAVVIRETQVRKGIGLNYEPAFDQPLRDGAEFTVLSENGDWVFGHFDGIGDGWLRRADIVR